MFCFKDRPILQIGYPRNDILINDNSPAKIREYKEKLGLPLDRRLYYMLQLGEIMNIARKESTNLLQN